ncbi:MAG: hypothetical protein HYZ22_02190 [Chloroflexi bacterium]|nr:hypothetical protein [Chloroflexota bacterium]
MITVIAALIFYIVDPMLGIIVALVLPYAVSLDTTGDYAEVVVALIFAVAVYFVRKVAFDQEEG